MGVVVVVVYVVGMGACRLPVHDISTIEKTQKAPQCTHKCSTRLYRQHIHTIYKTVHSVTHTTVAPNPNMHTHTPRSPPFLQHEQHTYLGTNTLPAAAVAAASRSKCGQGASGFT